ncbi:response regulator receiver domain-containing protein [Paucimonas lemoignei]|uniref:histidine kinase n=1 Tax=Paucimonas lemoignei TaxID=29443 RepID=A0A4R3I2R5_PAULE|nr:response regulator [Paucimonas lemoignei]TCS39313.1 response regulator receiver domain-containing protein [Paucimonas lemoignei]
MQSTLLQALTPKVLLIDDQNLAAELVEGMLYGQEDIELKHLTDPLKAVETALAFNPSVILVDLVMPTISGFDVLHALRSCSSTVHVPTILLSSEDKPELKAKGFSAGANDYLVKWPDKQELIARVRYHSNAYSALLQRDHTFQSLQKSQEELLLKTHELAESQAALFQAQKIEAIGKLTGGVAHDFNNVLQIISSNLQLLKIENPGNEKMQHRISAALEGVKRGALLASQLLAFGRRQPLQPGAVDIGALLRGAHELLRRSLSASVTIETEIDEHLWPALVDGNRLENVILNLAINARDAMQGQGHLRIEAKNFIHDDVEIRKRFDLDFGEYVQISVSDTGPGMSEEVKSRAFEPFFTTKEYGEGTGLGLSMAYGFAKQSRGHIDIDSRVGHGTMVRLYLPRAVERSTDAAIPQSNDGADAHANPAATILVVEDEEAIRAATAEILRKSGYRTFEAAHAQEALDLLLAGTRIDLLFSDVIMPGPLRSTELAKRATELQPHIKVLFASGFVDERLLANGTLPPGVMLLGKPYSKEDLVAKVQEMLSTDRTAVRS